MPPRQLELLNPEAAAVQAVPSSRKNWIAVASAEHARRGCAADDGPGYMQVCHGKGGPLQRVRAGDRVAYYAPALTMGGKDRLQCFVSIGTVLPGDPYRFDMGGGFVPFRKDVDYVAAHEASILPLVPQFEFVESPQRWGYKFRFGLFDISDHDMRLIAQAMQADLDLLHL
ncbi:EVE domain-containing protein [Rhodoferax sp.]|uniref:EVE domain-containing protein n=1 Tax=Rhodoferax sp. TaxID=50421 RepID=UPI00374D4BB9